MKGCQGVSKGLNSLADAMDYLHYGKHEPNFNLFKEKRINHHSSKEHNEISKIRYKVRLQNAVVAVVWKI